MDIKETLEALRAVNAFSVKLLTLSKDGLQVTDGISLATDRELIALAIAAGSGAQQIPAEMKDLDANEVKQLMAALVEMVGAQLAAIGVQPGNRLLKVLPLLPKTAALVQEYQDAWATPEVA